jgi:hypothetical protein
MSKPIALILGSGANLGSRVADRLRSDGYRVATVSRSKATDKDDEEDALTLKADFADPKEVESVFATVREVWGEPSVVVYNGMKAFAPVASKQESQSIFLSLSLFTPTTNTSPQSLLPHPRPNPRISIRHPNARFLAPPRRQHYISFCRCPRSFERFSTTGPWKFLLHG